MLVKYDKAKDLITLTGKHWSDRFPPDQLAGKLKLYRGLRDRAGGQYSHHYADTVKGLEDAGKAAQASSFPSQQ